MTQAQIHEIEELVHREAETRHPQFESAQNVHYNAALPYALKLAESEQANEALRLTIAEMTVEMENMKAFNRWCGLNKWVLLEPSDALPSFWTKNNTDWCLDDNQLYDIFINEQNHIK